MLQCIPCWWNFVMPQETAKNNSRFMTFYLPHFEARLFHFFYWPTQRNASDVLQNTLMSLGRLVTSNGNKSVFSCTNIKTPTKISSCNMLLCVTQHNYASLSITTYHWPSLHITAHHYISLHITTYYYRSLLITIHHYTSLSITTHHYPSLYITILTTHHYRSLYITIHH